MQPDNHLPGGGNTVVTNHSDGDGVALPQDPTVKEPLGTSTHAQCGVSLSWRWGYSVRKSPLQCTWLLPQFMPHT